MTGLDLWDAERRLVRKVTVAAGCAESFPRNQLESTDAQELTRSLDHVNRPQRSIAAASTTSEQANNLSKLQGWKGQACK